jgi:hypothetical protein
MTTFIVAQVHNQASFVNGYFGFGKHVDEL